MRSVLQFLHAAVFLLGVHLAVVEPSPIWIPLPGRIVDITSLDPALRAPGSNVSRMGLYGPVVGRRRPRWAAADQKNHTRATVATEGVVVENGAENEAVNASAAAAVNESKYEAAIKRTRENVVMRDSDILLVTFPKSGTHFLTGVVTSILQHTTGGYWIDAEKNDKRAIPNETFHGYPVFTLLPDDRFIDVPMHTYRFAEGVPKEVPRIFLTHQPPDELEYTLTPKTKVVYLMREPHSVCASLYNFFLKLLNEMLMKDGEHAPAMDPEPLVADFMGKGEHDVGVVFPPRLRDDRAEPKAYTWHRHILEWWQVGLDRGPENFRVLDFNNDVLASSAVATETVRRLANFLIGPAKASALDIRKIQQRNSLSSLTETLDERDANYHFHGGKVDGWHSAFEHLPHEAHVVFNKTSLSVYEQKMRQRKIAHFARRRGLKSAVNNLQSRVARERGLWL